MELLSSTSDYISLDVKPNTIQKVVPSPRDECNVFIKLAGRNEIEYVEVCGWTRTNHIRFPGLKNDLKMKGPELPTRMTWKDYVDDLDTYRHTIKNLTDISEPTNYNQINAPLLVQVIAKKTSRVLMLENNKYSEVQTSLSLERDGSKLKRVFIIGNLLIADSSGSCIVTTWNEANQVFNDQVEVGDILLIGKAQFKSCPSENFKSQYPFQTNLLQMELKIDKYSIRHVKHFPYTPTDCQKLPPYLFPPDQSKLYVPFDILNDTSKRLPFFDVIGMITYVGGLQRYETFQGDAICLVTPVYGTSIKGIETIEGDVRRELVKQYYAYRWIQIIDKTSKPLLVKVYLHNGTKAAQSKLVPGALIIITHCQNKDGLGFANYIQTSLFSYVYVNGELRKYFKIMPKTYVESVKDRIISLQSCKQILQRQDILWSVGGTLPMLIIHQDKFYQQFLLNLADPTPKIQNLIPEGKTFRRREVYSIYFHGIIDSILEINNGLDENHLPEDSYNHKVILGSSSLWSQIEADWNCYQSCNCKDCELLHWFYSRRKLPPIQVIENVKSSVKLLDIITKNHADNFCGPLLLPAHYTPIPYNTLPPLGNCPKLHEDTYYRLLLWNDENEKYYKVIFKGHPFEILKSKMIDSKGRIIIGILDFYYCESDGENGMEILLRDFIFKDEFQSKRFKC